MILDTVAGKDTLKVVLFRDSMIRCSINNLADTFNAARDYMHWDTSFSDYLSYNVAPILIPGEKKPKKFILAIIYLWAVTNNILWLFAFVKPFIS